MFNICQLITENAEILDLYAGSGAIGLEGISRGALSATFVEEDRYALKAIEKNIEELGCKDQAVVLRGDAIPMLKQLAKQDRTYDLIYADPPYEHCDYPALITLFDELSLLKSGGILFVEAPIKPAIQIPPLQQLSLKKILRPAAPASTNSETLPPKLNH